MRIALLGPIAWRTPPRAYGPWEQIVALLADGLTARGVDVTLFATLDSGTAARVAGVCPRPYNEDTSLDGRIWEALHVAHCFARSGSFDLVHNNLDWLPLAMSGFCQAPLLTTIHGFSNHRILPAYQHSNSAFVSISNADRTAELSYLDTVYHGIDTTQFPFCASPSEALVAFGRIHPDTGPAEAIAIARRAGRRLLICGPVHDEEYHARQVAPLIDGESVCYLGNVGPAQRAKVLGEAAALLHPIGFAEPFGLAVVEAMVCGTPVIAYPRGSMPEIIDEGITGTLVPDVAAAVDALPAVLALDRARVRETALRRFSAERMVEDYLRVYSALLLDRAR
jgi:glycosyltransferase involved in cell wall biosynthesis